LEQYSVQSSVSDIVKRCGEGNRGAYRELYDLYKNRIYTTAMRMLGNAQDAEEATQDVFIRIFNNIGSFRGDSSILTWMYRITVNTCIEYIRKRRKDNLTDSFDEPESIHQPSVQPERVTAQLILEHELEQLPEGCRSVFVLHSIEGFKHREIAEMMDITTGTSKSQLSTAKARLREKLLPYLEVLRYEL